MSRAFSGTTQYLSVDSAPVTAAPFTVAAWARCSDVNSFHRVVSIGDKDATDIEWALEMRNFLGSQSVRWHARSSGDGTATAGAWTDNRWHHVAGVEASSTSRYAYLDGTPSAQNTTSKAPAGADRISIGRPADSTVAGGEYFAGDIAEVGVWNVALTTAEITMLARGVSPLNVRPDSLVFYAPLVGKHSPEPDLVGGLALTVTGATASAHPRQFRKRQHFVAPPPHPPTQTISPSGIATAEAFGTAKVNGRVALEGIATAEAFGTPVVAGPVIASGIATAEAFGTPRVNPSIAPSGIATAEAFGTPVVTATENITIVPTGIATAEAFGTLQLNQQIVGTGIATAEAFGTLSVNQKVVPTGIATAEAFGSPVVVGPLSGAGGIAAAEAFGTARLDLKIHGTGIPTAEAFGTAQINRTLPVTGIPTEEAFGTARISAGIGPVGIATAEAFGTPVVAGPIVASGIATAEAFGTARVDQQVVPTGIATAEAFGTLSVNRKITPSGIATAEAFGTLSVNRKITPTGIPTAEQVPTPGMVQYIHASGIATAEAFGTATSRLGLPPAAAAATPTAEQVAAALSAHPSTSMRYRFYRYDREGTLVDDVSSAILDPGSVSLDNRRPVVRDLDIDLDEDRLPSDWDFATDVLGVTHEVYVPEVAAWAAMPLGRFLLDVSEVEHRDSTTTLKCQGSDLAILLVRATRSAPYTVAAGTTYTAAVEAILEHHGVPYVIPASALVTPQAYTWGPGASDYEICRDLLIGINYYPIWADASGVFRSRERIDPSTEDVAVTYQDTAEPRMVSADDPYVRRDDPKLPNRCVVIIDDPRNSDYGYVQRENADPDLPNSTATLAYGTESTISTSSVNDPSVIVTTADHDVQTDVTVLISGHSGSTPDINGSHIITKVSATAFSIPVNVTAGGTGGTAQPTTTQMLVLDGDSDPPTKCVKDATVAGEIADFELRWAAMLSRTAQLPTLLDPRREAHEWYRLDLDGVEDSTLWGVVAWKMRLRPGETMVHEIGLASEVTLLSPPEL